MDGEAELNAVEKLTKDLKDAVSTLTPREVRFLVDTYYRHQDNRKRAASQVSALEKRNQPHRIVGWLSNNNKYLESQVKRALAAYSKSKPMGVWAESNVGIGPVISAGLMAHIDITKAPTYGHVWSFAGLTHGFGCPVKWEKGKVRPWNAKLSVLLWKASESFVKFSGRPDCFYGQLYVQEKAKLIGKNERGEFRAAAEDGSTRVGSTTDAWKWYSGCYKPEDVQAYRDALIKAKEISADEDGHFNPNDGELTEAQEAELEKIKPKKGEPGSGTAMLPPAHIQARAQRRVKKLFISHWWEEAYKQHYHREPPPPYPIAHMNHVHIIKSPVPSLAKIHE